MMNDEEVWKPVIGWESSYEVSDHGRVRSVPRWRRHSRNPDKLVLVRGQLRKLFTDTDRRVFVSLSRPGVNGRVSRMVHRLVLEAFVGPCPPGMECCHFDGDSTNNHLSNLRWDTHSSNQFDRVRHRTHPQVLKVNCPRGHPLRMPNLVAAAAQIGRRECLACSRGRAYVNYHKGLDLQLVSDRYYEQIMRGSAAA